MRALLDVGVLVALLDAAHVHHRDAWRWLERELAHGWASCPLTQNGCVRVMSSPAYPGARPPAEVAARLAEATADPSHAFWPADLSLLSGRVLRWERILGHRQITEAYLLALAVRHGGRLVTLDRRLRPDAVRGAGADHVVTLGA